MFTANVGTTDRIIRILAGAFIISLNYWGPESAWAWLGLIPLLTGLIGWCGLYRLLGVKTCDKCPVQADATSDM